jgi:hypothetical protein
MPTNLPDQLFTSVNITGVGIATVAVNVFTNTLYKLTKLSPEWTAFIASLLIAYIVTFLSTSALWYNWVLAFFNACLLYCSAFGLNEMGAEAFSTNKQGFARPGGLINSWIKPGY